MKAEEHPLSQKPLGPLRLDSGEQMKLLSDKLLKAEQELGNEYVATIDMVSKLRKEIKILNSDHEDAIRTERAKLEAILKGLEELNKWFSTPNPNTSGKKIVTDLLSQHSK